MELFRCQCQILPVLTAKGTGTESLAVDACFRRKDAVGQLLFGHFQAENSHRHLLLHGNAGGNVQRKTGLAHPGAGGQNDKVAAAQAGQNSIQQAETGGNALVLVGIRAADLLQVGQRLHHAGGKRGQRAGIPPGADLVDALLRIFQQQVRVRLIARLATPISWRTRYFSCTIWAYAFTLEILGTVSARPVR